MSALLNMSWKKQIASIALHEPTAELAGVSDPLSAPVARLLGVRVGRMLTLGWALAGLIGALAGVLVSPSTFLYPNSMDSIFVLGFTAAVIGGLDSPAGAVAGGLILGVALSYVGGYLGSDLVLLFGLAALVLVLMIRPSGLFSPAATRQV